MTVQIGIKPDGAAVMPALTPVPTRAMPKLTPVPTSGPTKTLAPKGDAESVVSPESEKELSAPDSLGSPGDGTDVEAAMQRAASRTQRENDDAQVNQKRALERQKIAERQKAEAAKERERSQRGMKYESKGEDSVASAASAGFLQGFAGGLSAHVNASHMATNHDAELTAFDDATGGYNAARAADEAVIEAPVAVDDTGRKPEPEIVTRNRRLAAIAQAELDSEAGSEVVSHDAGLRKRADEYEVSGGEMEM